MLANDFSELLAVGQSVAREKGLSGELMVDVMREAIRKVAHSRYGNDVDIRVEVDQVRKQFTIWRVTTVVESPENLSAEISLPDARLTKEDAEIGDELLEELPPVEVGRVAVHNAKQVVVQRVREAERERQYEEYKDRVGEVINGIVQRVEHGNVIVELPSQGEGTVRYRELIPRENYNYRDRIRALICDVRREVKGPQVFLSRTRSDFMVKLFTQEVPEIYEGIVEIKACARDPGSRAKIAVISNDSSVDPVGACVGMRGSRVQAVVSELQGERVDIINWSPDPATFVVNAMAPAEVTKVVIDDERGGIDVVVPDEQLSLAIGRRGQNVRLAAELTGWEIDIMTEAQESDMRQKEFTERTSLFVEALNVDEVIGQLLVAEGFASVEEVAEAELEDLSAINGFDEDTSAELIERGQSWVEEVRGKQLEQAKELGVDDSLLEFGLPLPWVIRLAQSGILSLEDFAGSVPDDLVGWTERNKEAGTVTNHEGVFTKREVSRKQAEMFITHARVEMGWIEPPEEPEEEGEGADAEQVDGAEAALVAAQQADNLEDAGRGGS